MSNLKVVALAALMGCALPAAAQEDETFVEIKPGDISADPDNLIRGAERGDVRALNNLGLLWARGVGVPAPDFKEAMRWWKEAAKRGYSLSMNNLGLLYANGHGVKQDYAKALEWWEMSAERGDAWAMNSIGDLYENGLGVERDYGRARDWYERAAQAGDGLGMYNLASMYENGRGVDPDPQRALTWYQLSADKGVGVAMAHLGKMIGAGKGVPADPAEGYAWLTLASSYFSPEDQAEAAENARDLAALAPTLDAQQLSRAQEIAKNRRVVIEERRKAKQLKAGPGESET
jgi:uncharacterized protein